MKMQRHEPFRNPIWEQKKFLKDEVIDLFAKEIRRVREDLPSEQHSNFGGWQSPSFEQIKGIEFVQPLLKSLVELLTPLYEDYGILQPVDTSNIVPNIQNLWFNINTRDDWNYPHTHPQAILSAVVYIEVPEDSGNIVFDRPDHLALYTDRPDRPSKYGNIKHTIVPEAGTLLVFPAWVTHHVTPSNSDEERITVAINFG